MQPSGLPKLVPSTHVSLKSEVQTLPTHPGFLQMLEPFWLHLPLHYLHSAAARDFGRPGAARTDGLASELARSTRGSCACLRRRADRQADNIDLQVV